MARASAWRPPRDRASVRCPARRSSSRGRSAWTGSRPRPAPGAGGPVPQPREVAVAGASGPLRRAVAPDPVEELLDRYRLVGVHEERGQHAPLPVVPDLDAPAAGAYLDVSEDREVHHGQAEGRIPREDPVCRAPDLRFQESVKVRPRALRNALHTRPGTTQPSDGSADEQATYPVHRGTGRGVRG